MLFKHSTYCVGCRGANMSAAEEQVENVMYEYVHLHKLLHLHGDGASSSCTHARLSPWSEIKAQWRLAAPTMGATVVHRLFSIVSQLMAGHLSDFDLAALAISFSVAEGSVSGIMHGMGSALETLCGQAFGARQFSLLGIYMQQSVIVLTGAAMILTIPLSFAEPILKLLGQSTKIAAKCGTLLRWMLPQLYSLAVNTSIQNFLAAQSLLLPILCMSTTMLLFHIILCWVAAFDFKAGLVGIIMAQNVSAWLLAAIQFLYVLYSSSCQETWNGFSTDAFRQLPSFLKLSISSAIMVFLQIWYYPILIFLAGTLKDPEVDIDALCISINVILLEMVIPRGFSIAVSIRVSNELGAGNAEAASHSVYVALATSSVVSILFGIICYLCKSRLGYLFTENSSVAEKVSQLVPFLIACIMLNGIWGVLSGVAIGTGSQHYVANVNLLSCYVVGLPLGLLICYKFGLGIIGIWCGMIAGVLLQGLILLYATWNIDWREKARQATMFHGQGEDRFQSSYIEVKD